MEFTFDSRLETDGTAGTLYTLFRTSPEWKDVAIFDTKVSFEGGWSPRLEMADLVAREAMKELDRVVSGSNRKERRSHRALVETGRFRFTQRRGDYFDRWRTAVDAIEAGEEVDGYVDWLVKTRRVQHNTVHDTVVNRMTYFAWREHQGALLKRSDG
jgi:hypothetical protein